jgi:hypothetical protein
MHAVVWQRWGTSGGNEQSRHDYLRSNETTRFVTHKRTGEIEHGREYSLIYVHRHNMPLPSRTELPSRFAPFYPNRPTHMQGFSNEDKFGGRGDDFNGFHLLVG